MTDDAHLVCRGLRRRTQWYFPGEDQIAPRSDVPADVLVEQLRTHDNTLSVFLVKRADIPRWAAAMTAKRDALQEFDWAGFPADRLSSLEIDMRDVAGDTLDAEVNTWHRDLVSLSAGQLADLAARLKAGGLNRVSRQAVTEAMREAVSQSWLDVDQLPSAIRVRLART